jgi:uroporphyrinogen decarboxylase
MNSRERLRTVFEGKEPDRIPIDFSSRSTAIEAEAYERLKTHLHILSPTKIFLRDHAEIEQEIRELFKIDTVFIRHFSEKMYHHEINGDIVFQDEWGVPWRKRKNGIYYELDNGKLEELDFDDFDWPEDIISEECLRLMEKDAREKYFTTCNAIYCDYIGPCVFERSWYIRGLSNFLMDLISDEKSSLKYLDRIFEIQIRAYKKILNAIGSYIDGFFVIDDVAMQNGSLISPELYRKIIKPYHKNLFNYIHKYGKKIIYHCCGSVTGLIPDFIDAGIDALNPLQFSACNMDPVFLKKEFGKDIVFWGGGVNTQETLAFGTPEKVKNEILQRVEILGKNGGYVFAAEHCIQPNTPVENILAIIETIQDCTIAS